MHLELVTLDGVKFAADAYSVILPTADGEITVLPDHEPLLSQLVPGVITIRQSRSDPDYKLQHFATYGGVLEISHKGVRILVDEATRGDEVNEAEARKAHEAALSLRKDAKEQVDIDKAEALVHRHGVRLAVAELHRRSAQRK